MTQNRKGKDMRKPESQIWEDNKKRIQEIANEHPECEGEPIFHFDGQYGFLSNFHDSDITVAGHSFLNGESAFQGFKDMKRIGEFSDILPGKAKRLGRQVRLRSDWEDIKSDVMYTVVLAKFSQNETLKEQLLDTGNRLLVEGNWWKDTTWGVSNGRGENRLGEILMRVRRELSE